MIDSQFIALLQELRAKGEAGRPEMRELMKNGNLDRLIDLAALGVGKQAKTARKGNASRIGDDFPGEAEKQAAIIYWERKRRPDLVANVEDIAEHFHAHHLGKGTRAESWPATWKTWYSNQLEFVKPPRDGDLFLASVTPLVENCNVASWVGRLECFYGDTDSPAGTWNQRWGGKPGAKPTDPIPENCACPAQAFALYIENRKRRA